MTLYIKEKMKFSGEVNGKFTILELPSINRRDANYSLASSSTISPKEIGFTNRLGIFEDTHKRPVFETYEDSNGNTWIRFIGNDELPTDESDKPELSPYHKQPPIPELTKVSSKKKSSTKKNDVSKQNTKKKNSNTNNKINENLIKKTRVTTTYNHIPICEPNQLFSYDDIIDMYSNVHRLLVFHLELLTKKPLKFIKSTNLYEPISNIISNPYEPINPPAGYFYSNGSIGFSRSIKNEYGNFMLGNFSFSIIMEIEKKEKNKKVKKRKITLIKYRLPNKPKINEFIPDADIDVSNLINKIELKFPSLSLYKLVSTSGKSNNPDLDKNVKYDIFFNLGELFLDNLNIPRIIRLENDFMYEHVLDKNGINWMQIFNDDMDCLYYKIRKIDEHIAIGKTERMPTRYENKQSKFTKCIILDDISYLKNKISELKKGHTQKITDNMELWTNKSKKELDILKDKMGDINRNLIPLIKNENRNSIENAKYNELTKLRKNILAKQKIISDREINRLYNNSENFPVEIRKEIEKLEYRLELSEFGIDIEGPKGVEKGVNKSKNKIYDLQTHRLEIIKKINTKKLNYIRKINKFVNIQPTTSVVILNTTKNNIQQFNTLPNKYTRINKNVLSILKFSVYTKSNMYTEIICSNFDVSPTKLKLGYTMSDYAQATKKSDNTSYANIFKQLNRNEWNPPSDQMVKMKFTLQISDGSIQVSDKEELIRPTNDINPEINNYRNGISKIITAEQEYIKYVLKTIYNLKLKEYDSNILSNVKTDIQQTTADNNYYINLISGLAIIEKTLLTDIKTFMYDIDSESTYIQAIDKLYDIHYVINNEIDKIIDILNESYSKIKQIYNNINKENDIEFTDEEFENEQIRGLYRIEFMIVRILEYNITQIENIKVLVDVQPENNKSEPLTETKTLEEIINKHPFRKSFESATNDILELVIYKQINESNNNNDKIKKTNKLIHDKNKLITEIEKTNKLILKEKEKLKLANENIYNNIKNIDKLLNTENSKDLVNIKLNKLHNYLAEYEEIFASDKSNTEIENIITTIKDKIKNTEKEIDIIDESLMKGITSMFGKGETISLINKKEELSIQIKESEIKINKLKKYIYELNSAIFEIDKMSASSMEEKIEIITKKISNIEYDINIYKLEIKYIYIENSNDIKHIKKSNELINEIKLIDIFLEDINELGFNEIDTILNKINSEKNKSNKQKILASNKLLIDDFTNKVNAYITERFITNNKFYDLNSVNNIMHNWINKKVKIRNLIIKELSQIEQFEGIVSKLNYEEVIDNYKIKNNYKIDIYIKIIKNLEDTLYPILDELLELTNDKSFNNKYYRRKYELLNKILTNEKNNLSEMLKTEKMTDEIKASIKISEKYIETLNSELSTFSQIQQQIDKYKKKYKDIEKLLQIEKNKLSDMENITPATRLLKMNIEMSKKDIEKLSWKLSKFRSEIEKLQIISDNNNCGCVQ